MCTENPGGAAGAPQRGSPEAAEPAPKRAPGQAEDVGPADRVNTQAPLSITFFGYELFDQTIKQTFPL